MLIVDKAKNFVIEDGCLKKYCGMERNIIVPNDVTAIGCRAFEDNQQLQCVYIPQGVTDIDGGAFKGCGNLETVILPEGLETIGGSAFELCSKLKSINLPESLHTLGWESFFSCKNLKTLRLPAALTRMGAYVFGGCSGLTDLTVDPSNPVLEQQGPLLFRSGGKSLLFCNRNASGSIRLPDSVEYIGDYSLESCTGITELLLPDHLKVVGLCSLYGCSGLMSLHFPESLVGIESLAMTGCSSLREVILPRTMQFLGSMVFWECKNLIELNFPDSITYIGDYLVADCRSLKKLTLPPMLEKVGKCAFENCSALKELVFPPSLRSIDQTALKDCRLDRLVFLGEVQGLNADSFPVSRNGELVLDWYPFSKLSAENQRKAARGIAHRIQDDVPVSQAVMKAAEPYLKENCADLWKEQVFRQVLLRKKLIPLEKFNQIVEMTLKENNPELNVQVLEYRHENFTPEEIEGEVWKRYESEMEQIASALTSRPS